MSLIKKLAGQTAIYGLTTIIGRFINYWLTPIHTSGILSISAYGMLTNVYAYVAFLNIIYTYGLETAYFRFATKSENQGQKPYNNAFTSILISSVVFSGLIWTLAPQIAVLLGFQGNEQTIRWVAIILASDAIVAVPFAKLRLLNKIYLFAGAKISNIILNYVLNLFFLIICPMIVEQGLFPELLPFVKSFYNVNSAIEYIFISNLLANIVYLPFLLPVAKGIRFSIDFRLWKEMFVYAFPIFLMGIPGMVNEMFSRIMIEKWLPIGFYAGKTSMEALGVFGASYKLSVFMVIATQAFKYASEPFFFSNSKDKNAPILFAKVMNYYVLATMTIFLVVCVNINWIAEIFIGQINFREALHIVPLLLIANLFFGIYFNLSVWYKLTDKTYWGTYITFGGAVITVVANYILIPIAGYDGSVLATFICYFSMALASYYFGQKYFPVPYSLFKISVYLIVGIILINIYWFAKLEGTQALISGNLLVISFVILGLLYEKLRPIT
ncbi:MAG: polysaccharide biosynthesis C-terminal domain-containing protein [Bacteroidota bacterium]|nr:polysaccharide biosynthesis C-terminal domain-containing protein [Bacteroidota bacterium]